MVDANASRLIWDQHLFHQHRGPYIGMQRLERKTRRAVGLLALIFALYVAAEVAGPMAIGAYAGRLNDKADGPVQVWQSTGWSCGPAALAWALRLKGMRVTERDVAYLAATTPLHGTTDRGMLRAAHKLGQDAFALHRASWEQLAQAPKPVLADVRLSTILAHMVVVIDIEGDEVRVGDPLLGESWQSREDFRRKWLGSMIIFAQRGTQAVD